MGEREEIQCSACVNRKQDRAGPQILSRVEVVVNDLTFTCNNTRRQVETLHVLHR